MVLYVGNHKDFTQKILDLINNSSKLREYKINMQKSILTLYTSNKEFENKEKTASHDSIKHNKSLGIYLTKEVQEN